MEPLLYCDTSRHRPYLPLPRVMCSRSRPEPAMEYMGAQLRSSATSDSRELVSLYCTYLFYTASGLWVGVHTWYSKRAGHYSAPLCLKCTPPDLLPFPAPCCCCCTSALHAQATGHIDQACSCQSSKWDHGLYLLYLIVYEQTCPDRSSLSIGKDVPCYQSGDILIMAGSRQIFTNTHRRCTSSTPY
jgi:hypothetical protein